MLVDSIHENQLARDSDPETSLWAAAKAAKASRRSIKYIRAVMADGLERTDEEIWTECRKLKFVSSLSVVQHGRLALSKAGLLLDTGGRRKTSENTLARVWRTTEAVSRSVMNFTDGPENAKKGFSRTSREIAKMNAAYESMRSKIANMVESARAELERAREISSPSAETGVSIRLRALEEALAIVDAGR